MVLSNHVRDILLKQQTINSLNHNFKSLIPSNNIPDIKQEYHKNMLTLPEKTINLNKKSNKKNKLEIVVNKDFSFDENIEIPDDNEEKEEPENSEEPEDEKKKNEIITFFDTNIIDDDDDDNNSDSDNEEVKEIKEDDKEIKEIKEEYKEVKEEELNLLDIIDKNDEIIIEDIKSEQDSDIKKIKITEPSDTLEQSGGVKRIKLDQKYNFF